MRLIDADAIDICAIGKIDDNGETLVRLDDVYASIDRTPTLWPSPKGLLTDADDLISRQALIDWLAPYLHMDEKVDVSDIISDIKTQPAIKSYTAPVRGRWIDWKYDNMKCSACGSLWLHDEESYKFCPNSGADMREEKHETD